MQNSGVHQKYNCVLERNRIDLTNKKLCYLEPVK